MFEKIAVISIPVKDQQAAKSFYVNVLGCTVVQEIPFGMPDTMWIRLALPGVDTQLVLATWFPAMAPGSLQGLVLATKRLDQTHAELQRRGLDISPIQKQEWGREATFADGDGNGWVLQEATS
jgi:catechol 2,3-dioxygenase-like lactoylglutathione lyase family enzyme